MILVFINELGPNFKGDNIYEFIFSDVDDVYGEEWDSEPANGKPSPPKVEFIKRVGVLKNSEIEDAIYILTLNNVDFKKPIIMISAIGSSEAKTYPLHHMAKVIDEIAENKSVQILFNYIPNQKNTALELYNLCQLETQEQIFFDIYAKSLREFMGLTSQCAALIGNEGGAINMAKALNIPTFTISIFFSSKLQSFSSIMDVKSPFSL